MKTVKSLFAIAAITFAAIGAFIASGIYPMGADEPHNELTYWMLETLREQSIDKASKGIKVPLLTDSELLLAGGSDYNEMCAGCHLKPGAKQSEMAIGLYPAPPNLSLKEAEHGHDGASAAHGDSEQSSRRQFWIIKHGVKASGMPAWGPTHEDQRIWGMVAFLQKLPELTPEQYQTITAGDVHEESPHH